MSNETQTTPAGAAETGVPSSAWLGSVLACLDRVEAGLRAQGLEAEASAVRGLRDNRDAILRSREYWVTRAHEEETLNVQLRQAVSGLIAAMQSPYPNDWAEALEKCGQLLKPKTQAERGASAPSL